MVNIILKENFLLKDTFLTSEMRHRQFFDRCKFCGLVEKGDLFKMHQSTY